MTMTYQLTSNDSIIARDDGAMIPTDPAAVDYQAYLAWVAEGNTPDPAPTVAPPVEITTGEFLNRFTPAEQAAVQSAAMGNATIALGLTMGLAFGEIDLQGPIIGQWMASLVTAGAITQDRATAIITP